MSMLPTRATFRFAMFCAATAASLALAPAADAASVSYGGMCARSVQVVQWSPQKGPIARFVADTFLNKTETGVWIGLGRVGTSFWSAEGGDDNDACDDCRTFYLVETRANGTRKRHRVFERNGNAPVSTDPAVIKAHLLATLWKLAKSDWPADKLMQDYKLALGQPNAEENSDKPLFAVHVRAPKTLDLRYDFNATTSMCWCFYDWKAQSTR